MVFSVISYRKKGIKWVYTGHIILLDFGHFGHRKKEPNPVKPITQIMINL